MATQYVTPDYDRSLEPRESSVPDDHLQCIECGYVVAAECLTELESELEVCSERCGVKVVQDLHEAARRAARQAVN